MDKEKEQGNQDVITFKYIFLPDLKELHVSGAFGGLAPDGSIRMALYSERQAIPNFEKHVVKSDKTLGEVIEQDKKYDMVRIVQSSIVFNATTARSFMGWLKDKIDESEKFQVEARKLAEKRGE